MSPTMRLRLDRLIKKIQAAESKEEDFYLLFLQELIEDGKVTEETGKILISQYRKRKRDFMF